MREYHDLYVQSDSLELAEIFENFRNFCLRKYKLNLAYFYTTPGLALEGCFKMARIKLELPTNKDMLLIFEKGIRGGFSQATHRYAKADNKYMPNCDIKQLSSSLMYLDANNLYGWAICEKVPIGGYIRAKNLDR